MNEIPLEGHEPRIGKLVIDPDGPNVRLSVTAGGATELTVSLSLRLADAEAASSMLSDAIDEANDYVESMQDNVLSVLRPETVEDEPVLVGELPF